jgi:hypothetical protein
VPPGKHAHLQGLATFTARHPEKLAEKREKTAAISQPN